MNQGIAVTASGWGPRCAMRSVAPAADRPTRETWIGRFTSRSRAIASGMTCSIAFITPLSHAGALAHISTSLNTTSMWMIAAFLFSLAVFVWHLRIAHHRADRLTQRLAADLDRLSMVAKRTTNAVIITDAQQRIEWVNDGFTRITGYMLEEVVGKIPGQLLQCEKTDRDVVARMSEALRAGRGCRVEVLNRGKHGNEYVLDVEIQPIHDATGKLTGFMAIESDITDRVAAREALAASEARLRTVIDTALDAVVSMDANGFVTQWNKQAEATFGWTADEAVGRQMSDLIVPEEMRQAHHAGLRRYLETGETRVLGRRIEVPAIRKDGTRLIVELAINPVHHDSGLTFSAFLRDITPRKQAEEALKAAREAAEAASRAKSEFLANTSHEIRTPMTAILGYAELLADHGARNAAQPECLEYIATLRRNGEHLLSIINDILDLSKIEAGRMTVERIPTRIEQILMDIESLMRVKAGEKNLSLEIRKTTPIPETILTDPVRLRQILVNVVGNALKFTERGGVWVRVSIDEPKGSNPQLRIEVEDTGIGMTPQQTSRIFDAFEQADSTTTRKFGGTGLGLCISRRLARMLGGDLTATSAPGRGSTFTLTVQTGALQGVRMLAPGPISRAVRSAPMTTCDAAQAEPLRGVRIFLVEDGPDNQRLIAFHLKKAGADVRIFDNGRLALEALTQDRSIEGPLLKEPPCDFVLTDMQMPELDGYSLARMLRAKGWNRAIVALTAHAMTGDADRCFEAGCDDYATKPIDRARLIDTCLRAAARTRIGSETMQCVAARSGA